MSKRKMSRERPKSSQPRGKPRGAVAAQPQRKEAKSSASSKPARPGWLSAAGMREAVETVVFIFVLMFLFRTFEAEAFVIPTGSMAPTLLGRHKDVVCPQCEYRFQVSASDEVDNTSGRRRKDVDVVACTCPMCRYTMRLDGGNPQGESYRSYNGDRILVSKFFFQVKPPQRWDVAVFKYPGGAKTNFIKRIVGLPNETVAISHGDVFIKPAEEDDFADFARPPDRYRLSGKDLLRLDRFKIARKPPHKIRAMLQPVHDNDRVAPKLVQAGWPARWAPAAREDLAPGWEPSDEGRSFHTAVAAPGEAWIGYRHLVPSFEDWQHLKDGTMPPRLPRPQLIMDFSAYNTDVTGSLHATYQGPWAGADGYGSDDGFTGETGPAPSPEKLGLHWVGDLAVQCTMEVENESGQAILELREGGRVFQCRIDVATGQASLSISGLEGYRPTAQTPIRGPGEHRIMFANVDDQLTLWINGRVVRFDGKTAYPRLDNTAPDENDLQPVRIGSRGAALTVSHLKIYRDVYYIAERLLPGYSSGTVITDFLEFPYHPRTREDVARLLSDPRQWGYFQSTRQVAFPLGEDQFFVLGDNSAESKDSRLWESERFPCYVSRELLVGKAFVIYWPHSLDRIPGTEIPIRFFPNFRRMWVVQ